VALISLRQLLECGVHFGHPTRKWNPKMSPFIYTKRNGIHILDLQQTTKFIDEAHAYVQELVGGGKTILFVGTKKQAQDAIREEATKCGMPFICQRWPGGLLTNRQTIFKRIERLRELRRQKEEGYFDELTKKDRKFLEDELAKLEKMLGGVADLDGLPDAMFVVDVKKEVNAVHEAKKLGIPIIGILDTNCDPEDVDYKLPGNDDAIRSIRLFCQIVADSVMEAKYGYLPPDSVFIRAAEEQAQEEAAAEKRSKPAPEAPAEPATPEAPPAEAPSAAEPAADAPPAEAPVAAEPAAETPTAAQPAAEAVAAPEVAAAPPAETPAAEEAVPEAEPEKPAGEE
jgi:small subunit ribosomal protein S2